MKYLWGNNVRRAQLKGKACEIMARGKMGSILIRFSDTGEMVVTSWRAVG